MNIRTSGYTDGGEVLDCQHTHDSECGYVQADPGQPCGYECPLCPIEALIAALPQTVAEDTAASNVAPQAEDTVATVRTSGSSDATSYTSVQDAWEAALNSGSSMEMIIEIVQNAELTQYLSMNNSSCKITLSKDTDTFLTGPLDERGKRRRRMRQDHLWKRGYIRSGQVSQKSSIKAA